MTSERITTVLDELRAEEADLQEKLDSLREQMKCGEAQLTQIRKALTSLKGKSSNMTNNSKRTATREEVVETVRHVLSENGSASESDLKRLVEDRISSRGKSRVGLAMRFKSALKDGQFVRKGSMLALATASNHEESEGDRDT